MGVTHFNNDDAPEKEARQSNRRGAVGHFKDHHIDSNNNNIADNKERHRHSGLGNILKKSQDWRMDLLLREREGFF